MKFNMISGADFSPHGVNCGLGFTMPGPWVCGTGRRREVGGRRDCRGEE